MTTRRRSIAWLFYALLTFGAIVAGFSGSPLFLLVAVVLGAYAVYLFRGGSFVLWFF